MWYFFDMQAKQDFEYNEILFYSKRELNAKRLYEDCLKNNVKHYFTIVTRYHARFAHTTLISSWGSNFNTNRLEYIVILYHAKRIKCPFSRLSCAVVLVPCCLQSPLPGNFSESWDNKEPLLGVEV